MPKALITAALGGLGSLITNELVSRGYECYGTTSRSAKATEQIFHWDMTSTDSTKNLLQSLKPHEIEVFIHCAHVFSPAKLSVQVKPEEFQENLQHNTTEIFRLTQSLSRKMNRKKKGHIAFIGSLLALNPAPGKIQYITEKMALQGMLGAIASEYEDLNFKIFHPGLIDTPQVMTKISSEVKALAGKMLKQEEVARQVVADLLESRENLFEVKIAGEQKW